MDTDAPPVCIYEPRGPLDIALIEMAFAGTDVVFHVENQCYALATGGPAVGDARMRLFVRGDQVADARDLLRRTLPI